MAGQFRVHALEAQDDGNIEIHDALFRRKYGC